MAARLILNLSVTMERVLEERNRQLVLPSIDGPVAVPEAAQIFVGRALSAEAIVRLTIWFRIQVGRGYGYAKITIKAIFGFLSLLANLERVVKMAATY